MKHNLLIILCAILAVTSCRKTGSIDTPVTDTRRDFVTIKSISENGDVMFELQERDDSPKFNLYAKGADSESLKPNKRVVINYYETNRRNESERDVAILSYISTHSDSIRQAPLEKIQSYKSNPIQLTSMWRSGEFINIACLVQYTGKTRLNELVIDSSTLDNEVVEAYLIDDLMNNTGAFYRKMYASYNIAAVWKRAKVRGLRIYVNDMVRPDVKYLEFIKPN